MGGERLVLLRHLESLSRSQTRMVRSIDRVADGGLGELEADERPLALAARRAAEHALDALERFRRAYRDNETGTNSEE